MKIIDLSHKIDNNIITYSENEKVYINKISTINKNGYNVYRINLTSHSGTHVDAPNHMIQNGNTLDDISLCNFIGKGFILDLKSENFILENLIDFIDLNNLDFLFFYTGAESLWNTTLFLETYNVPSKNIIDKISKSNLKGIGTDAISIDTYDSRSFYNHNTLLKNNKIIYECLNSLSKLVGKYIYFYGVPLKIDKGDASPVRAFCEIV